MLELLQMWALLEVLGLLILPLTVTVFHNLPDRGWSFSKSIGLAVFAFLIWAPLNWVHALPYSRGFILGATIVLAVAGLLGFYFTYRTVLKVVRRNIAYIVVSECVFLGMVFLLGWLRSFDPDIRSFEMFMDEGFIAAIMRSPHMPPNDMWFSGYSINYYYYAHFAIASAAKLLGQPASIAFNTGISIFFGLTAVNLFGVTINIVAWMRHVQVQANTQPDQPLEPASTVYPPVARGIPFGLASIAMGLVLGNLAATQQWWQNHGELTAHFDWFVSSRVIPNTINEFPAFSFLLSCFHAHVLALAFTILAIGLAFNLFLEANGKGLNAFGHGWQIPCTLVTTALVIGGLYIMNGWDYPTYLGLAVVSIALQQWLAYERQLELSYFIDLASAAISLVVLSFILFLPFYLTFISPSQGLGLIREGSQRSPIGDELLIYGLFLFIFLSVLGVSAWGRPLFARVRDEMQWSERTLRTVLIALIALVVLDVLILLLVQNSLTLVVMGDIALFALLLTFYHSDNRGHAFLLFIGALAFTLIAACEIIYLRDVFANNNPPLPRYNTVFKFYFQAWALLSVGCGAGLFVLFDRFWSRVQWDSAVAVVTRLGAVVWTVGLALLVLACMVYPLMAPETRLAQYNPLTNSFMWHRSNSLDGLTYLQNCKPPDTSFEFQFCLYDVSSDYDAIRWINANIQGDPTIIEAYSNSGDYSLYGRISAFTGLPTPMGWSGHELQWRINWLNNDTNIANFNNRTVAPDSIYQTGNPDTVLSIMHQYNAQYLYVGALEHVMFPRVGKNDYGAFMQLVYDKNGVEIYKVKS